MFDFEKGGDLFFNKEGKLVRKPMPSRWQSIETAPMDTRLLLICGGAVVIGECDSEIRHSQDYNGDSESGWLIELEEILHEPTAWMPLPSPPEEV